MDYTKLEKFSKRMEVIHNRIFKWVCVAFVLYFVSAIPVVDLYSYIAMIVIGGFISYVIAFTTFQFPIKFGGQSRGIKQSPWA